MLHIPVMLNEILENYKPVLDAASESPATAEGLRYFDGTFGRGGHCQAVLDHFPQIKAVAFDQDPEAVQFAENEIIPKYSGRLAICHRNFKDFDVTKDGEFDLMLLDLGVSSPQLDQAHRGFSFYHDGPLDMRMNLNEEVTAATIINNYSEDELNDLFKNYGEIRSPYRVVRAVVHDRKTKAYSTTRELASLIERVEGWKQKGMHPATRFFMALRLVVNQELDILESTLQKLILGLKPKGRLAVLTFHSLEDRIVKNVFKNDFEHGRPVNKKVIQPGRAEEENNPRSRSAKLRVYERFGHEKSGPEGFGTDKYGNKKNSFRS